jgi:hypothetical protein
VSAFRTRTALLVPCVFLLAVGASRAADSVALELVLPRAQYTTAEAVELAVVYKNDGGNVKKLPLQVKHADGSSLTFEVLFDAPAGKAQTRILAIQRGTLKPRKYTATAKAGPPRAQTSLSHIKAYPKDDAKSMRPERLSANLRRRGGV